MKQSVLKIKEYAEHMLEDLNLPDWPETFKNMPRTARSIKREMCSSGIRVERTSSLVLQFSVDERRKRFIQDDDGLQCPMPNVCTFIKVEGRNASWVCFSQHSPSVQFKQSCCGADRNKCHKTLKFT